MSPSLRSVAQRARALLDRGEVQQALTLLETEHASESDDLDILLAYADALERSHRVDDAFALVDQAAARISGPALLVRGAGLAAARQDSARRDAFLQEAERRFPNDSIVLAAQADAGSDDGDTDRAIAFLRRAIECHDARLGPPVTHLLALNAELMRVGRADEGHALLEKADRRAATMPVTHSARVMTAHYYLPELGASESERHAALEAFRLDHRRFGDRFGVPIATCCKSHATTRGRKLRIGYVSPDFRDHSVARFFLPVLRAHDREHFEVFCYSTTLHQHDATTALIAASAAEFVDLRDLGTGPAAERIAADALDVVVDLAGHTGPHQLAIFARRVAPVQLSFLGYPDVTGLPEMDGFITDAVASPLSADAYAVEPLLRLPHTAWTFDPQIEALETSRAPSKNVVFGALHNLAKITDAMLRVWASILEGVPGSTLTLAFRTRTEEGRRAFGHRLVASGIAEERVTVSTPVPERQRHVERLREIDIVLDTFPYAGTTTTCEALWMGVPVVSLAGDTHASRVGASLLEAVGLDDLATSSAQAYVEAAVALARDAPRRASLRESLRARMLASPLGDAATFTRSLEALYERVREAKAALPGFDLVASGLARHAMVEGARLVLPSRLDDPESFQAVERGRLDDGELAFTLAALPTDAPRIDVLPATGGQALALASSGAAVTVFAPLLTEAARATLGSAPSVRFSDVLPGRQEGRASLGPRTARVAPLDDLVAGDVALIRLGVPGLERDILHGATRLLAQGALVLLERGFQPLGPAAVELASLGLVPHGLVHMLGALAPIEAEDSRRVAFAVSSACRARFGLALPVIEAVGVVPSLEGTDATGSCVRNVERGPLPTGVAAFIRAARAGGPLAERLACLRFALEASDRAVREHPMHVGRRLTLHRVLVELGDLGAAGAVLEPMMEMIDGPLYAAMDEPFLPGLPRYDAIVANDDRAWLRAQLIEGFVKSSAPSSFFHPPAFLNLFGRFDTLGFPDAEMDRREALLRSREKA